MCTEALEMYNEKQIQIRREEMFEADTQKIDQSTLIYLKWTLRVSKKFSIMNTC